MAPSPTIEFELGGQSVIFNQNSNVLILNIAEPFYSAGKILSWNKEWSKAGFGINKDIIKFICERRLKLLIRCDLAPQREYWINYDSLFAFVKSNSTEYFTHGLWLNIIPWSLFHPKPVFSIAL